MTKYNFDFFLSNTKRVFSVSSFSNENNFQIEKYKQKVKNSKLPLAVNDTHENYSFKNSESSVISNDIFTVVFTDRADNNNDSNFTYKLFADIFFKKINWPAEKI